MCVKNFIFFGVNWQGIQLHCVILSSVCVIGKPITSKYERHLVNKFKTKREGSWKTSPCRILILNLENPGLETGFSLRVISGLGAVLNERSNSLKKGHIWPIPCFKIVEKYEKIWNAFCRICYKCHILLRDTKFHTHTKERVLFWIYIFDSLFTATRKVAWLNWYRLQSWNCWSSRSLWISFYFPPATTSPAEAVSKSL